MKAIGIEGDVRKQEDAARVVATVFKHFGRLDILVNGAAGNFLVSPEDLSPNGFRTGEVSSLFMQILCFCCYAYDLFTQSILLLNQNAFLPNVLVVNPMKLFGLILNLVAFVKLLSSRLSEK